MKVMDCTVKQILEEFPSHLENLSKYSIESGKTFLDIIKSAGISEEALNLESHIRNSSDTKNHILNNINQLVNSYSLLEKEAQNGASERSKKFNVDKEIEEIEQGI
jgi:hypothetical protein